MKLDISKYGIKNVVELFHNPSYEFLFDEESKAIDTLYQNKEKEILTL